MEETLSPAACCIILRLDMERIHKLQLEVNVRSVALSIVEGSGKLKLKLSVIYRGRGVLRLV